jgi:hypothetical protein
MTFSDSLQLSRDTYSRLRPETVQDILETMGLRPHAPKLADAGAVEQAGSETGEGLVRFAERDWRKFLEGVSDKTREALNAVADLGPRYNAEALLRKLRQSKTFGPELTLSGLRGVEGGLTKRTRTVARTDETLYHSISWNDDDLEQCVVEWEPTTHAALRRVLGKN